MRGAALRGVVAPATATHHPITSYRRFPSTAICWRTAVAVVVPILTPLIHIPMHVVQTVVVSQLASNCLRPPVIVPTPYHVLVQDRTEIAR